MQRSHIMMYGSMQPPSAMVTATAATPSLRNAVDRFNRMRESLGYDRDVELENLERFRKELDRTDPDHRLWESLVYSPRNLSVYVRSECNGLTVDVGLCTQDVTSNSNVTLANIRSILPSPNNDVGTRKDIQAVPDIQDLSRIVQIYEPHRKVHKIKRFDNRLQITLARSYSPTKDVTNVNIDVDRYFGEVSKDLRRPFDRSSQDVEAAWVLCMYLFEQADETSGVQIERAKAFVGSCLSDFTTPNHIVTKHVNYESLFRSKHGTWQDGRLTWPVLLGVVTAKNIKFNLDAAAVGTDNRVHNLLASYKGRRGYKNFICIVVVLVYVGSLVAVVVKTGNEKWSTAVASILGVVFGNLSAILNASLLGDPSPQALWKPYDDDDKVPDVSTQDKATKVLLSASCAAHFNGDGLSFTGENYSREGADFTYEFSYADIAAMGFQRQCDASGREYLAVAKTGNLVRMLADNELDLDGPATRPNRLFPKLWVSERNPGEDRFKTML